MEKAYLISCTHDVGLGGRDHRRIKETFLVYGSSYSAAAMKLERELRNVRDFDNLTIE